MKEQKLIKKYRTSFEPKHIFECGQCFRWKIQPDGSYTGVIKENVINVRKEGETVLFKSMGKDKIEELVTQYFDLETDYEEIKKRLNTIDVYIKKSVVYGEGIRILRQDLWETIISFIISANNNIPRIKGIIEKISKAYGKEIKWKEEIYYTFPTVEELSKATVENLRELGLGFRDIRVFKTTQLFKDKKITFSQLEKEDSVENVREMLMQLPGVGPKVADCILLFGLRRFEVFPIDVWVRRVMNELYIKNEDETKVNKKEIEELAVKKYADLAGLAQQYLFYWKRETA